jgi:hypothetical protein
MTRVPNYAFFKIADGFGGHTQVLALFDRSNSPAYRGTSAATSTTDHIAFEIALSDFENELQRLRALGLEVELQSTRGFTGAHFTSPIPKAIKWS